MAALLQVNRFLTSQRNIQHSNKVLIRNFLSLPKDVVIYEKEAAGFARLIAFSGFAQWFVISYMSTVMYQNMPAFFKWIPVDESSKTQNERLPKADWKYRVGFSLCSFGAACGIMGTTFVYCFRTVSKITLLKNSDKVLFTTYTPLGTKRGFTTLVGNISAIQPRTGKMIQIPIKVKDHSFHYLVDKTGKFPQPSLFDRTVGIKRDFGFQKQK